MNFFTVSKSFNRIQWTRNYTLSQIMDKHKKLLLPKPQSMPKLLSPPPQKPVCKCSRSPSADIPRTLCKEKQQEQIKKAIEESIKFR